MLCCHQLTCTPPSIPLISRSAVHQPLRRAAHPDTDESESIPPLFLAAERGLSLKVDIALQTRTRASDLYVRQCHRDTTAPRTSPRAAAAAAAAAARAGAGIYVAPSIEIGPAPSTVSRSTSRNKAETKLDLPAPVRPGHRWCHLICCISLLNRFLNRTGGDGCPRLASPTDNPDLLARRDHQAHTAKNRLESLTVPHLELVE